MEESEQEEKSFDIDDTHLLPFPVDVLTALPVHGGRYFSRFCFPILHNLFTCLFFSFTLQTTEPGFFDSVCVKRPLPSLIKPWAPYFRSCSPPFAGCRSGGPGFFLLINFCLFFTRFSLLGVLYFQEAMRWRCFHWARVHKLVEEDIKGKGDAEFPLWGPA